MSPKIPSPIQCYNMITTVKSFLAQKQYTEKIWTVIEGHNDATVYVYAPNDDQDELSKDGYYVGINLEHGTCWVTGNPGWAVLFPKNSNVPSDGSHLSAETQAYIGREIEALSLRRIRQKMFLHSTSAVPT